MATPVPADAQVRHATLTSAIRAMFPHPSFPDGPYERTADAIVSKAAGDVRSQAQLDQGLVDLDAAAGGAFAALDAPAALEVLRGLSATPWFDLVRSTVVTTLYDDREVWALLGYEGESFSKGGYLQRGFDDLDWLPAAPIGEGR